MAPFGLNELRGTESGFNCLRIGNGAEVFWSIFPNCVVEYTRAHRVELIYIY